MDKRGSSWWTSSRPENLGLFVLRACNDQARFNARSGISLPDKYQKKLGFDCEGNNKFSMMIRWRRQPR
jgi:hypothetical protein